VHLIGQNSRCLQDALDRRRRLSGYIVNALSVWRRS